MQAKDIMKSPVFTVRSQQTLAEVSALFEAEGISGAPVVDDQDRLVGVISETDVLKWTQRLTMSNYRDPFAWASPHSSVEEMASFRQGLCEAGTARVSEAMSSKVLTCAEQDSLEDISRLMVRRNVNRVPVVRDGKVVGIITRGDMIWAMNNLCERKPGVFR